MSSEHTHVTDSEPRAQMGPRKTGAGTEIGLNPAETTPQPSPLSRPKMTRGDAPELSRAEMAPGFREFLKRVLAALSAMIASEWTQRRELLVTTADALLHDSADDLVRWSGLLASGAIAPRDYRWLVEGRADLAKLEALRLAGMSRGQIDRFRRLVAETVVTTAIGWFLGSR